MQFITMIVGFLLGFCIAGFMRAGKNSLAVGKWKAENTRPKSFMFVCSLCGKKAYDKPYGSAKHMMNKKTCKLKYCPNCGARMEGME